MDSTDLCEIYSLGDDYREYIIQYPLSAYAPQLENARGCAKRIGDRWVIYAGPVTGKVSVAMEGYFTIPKLYTVMDTESMEKSGIGQLHRQTGLQLTGEGIIVGMVDTGIDIFHEAFRDSAGYTRIGALWDQTDATGTPPEGYYYGSEYNSEMLNQYISDYERNDSGTAASPESSAYIPGRDTNGHGTFVMGIAAGSPDGSRFTGAAYYSEIAAVKLKTAKQYLKDYYFMTEEYVYSDTDIMQGVQYLIDYADRKKKPIVIMIGLGNRLGPHSGRTPLEYYLNEISEKPQTVVCVCTGNEAANGLHYEGVASGAEFDTVEFQVDEGQRGIIMELWSDVTEVFSVGLVSPVGEVVAEIPARLNMSSTVQFVLESTRVTIDYKIVEVLSGSEVVILRFEYPTAGIWRLRVYRGRQGARYNVWMGGEVGGMTRFVMPSPWITLTNPSSALNVISVAGYSHIDGSLYLESGRGFTANYQIKPDIAAPSVDVYGPRAGGGYTTRSGTSVGNAHVAGACAMLFEWGIVKKNAPVMNAYYIKSLLIRGARKKRGIMYPSREWGWGELDVYRIFEVIADIVQS